MAKTISHGWTTVEPDDPTKEVSQRNLNDHAESYSGLTAGHVLRASGATAADFAAIQDGDLPSTIARDSEVTAAVAALSAVYQPLDSDLTAIAALSTTSFGRSLLALADQAALLSAAGAAASGHNHAATYQPLDSDLTSIAALTTTAFGRAFLALANLSSLVTGFPADASLTGTEELYVNDGLVDKKATVNQVVAKALTPTLDLTAPSPTDEVLILRADPAQTEHVVRVYDADGLLAMDIDAFGFVDMRDVVIQSPPDTGVDAIGSITMSPRGIRIDSAIDDGGQSHLAINVAVTPSASSIKVSQPGVDDPIFAVLKGGAVVTHQNAAPANGELGAGQAARWFDKTNGAAYVMFKGKTADGTVVTGQLRLGHTVQTYAASNVTTDRTYDANATSIDELADVVGTLIADLRAQGIVA